MQKGQGKHINCYTFEPYCSRSFEQLWKWHKEHTKINFPTQKPDKKKAREDFKNHVQWGYILENEKKKKIGFVWYDIKNNFYENKEEGLIRYLHVDKEYRNQGIGKFLMNFAEEELRIMGAKFITLGTHVDNFDALSFYNEIGYLPYRITFRKKL